MSSLHTPAPLIRTALPGSLLAATLLSGALLGACGSDDPAPASESVVMTETWSRQPVEGQSTGAFYGTLTNDGEELVTAVGATSSVSDAVELHEVVMNDDGTMTMRERDGGYEIAAGESITLEPGGLHIMLLDIDPATYPDTVDVTIEFDDGSTIDVSGEVRAVDDMDMGETNHDMDEGMDDEMDMDG